MHKIELNISVRLNRLAKNYKSIFYLFRIITFTAEWWMYLFYATVLLIINYKNAVPPIQMGLIAYSIHYPIYYIIKNTLKRKRPFESYDYIKYFIKPPDKYSLPSGHASASTITTLIILYFFPNLYLIIAWPALVSISRIVLGLHYISDTMIGFLLGWICFYLAEIIWVILLSF